VASSLPRRPSRHRPGGFPPH